MSNYLTEWLALLQSFEVDRHDGTFSTLEGELRVAYGAASDCQVHEDCRLGIFNVNLTGTGFIVTQEVQ